MKKKKDLYPLYKKIIKWRMLNAKLVGNVEKKRRSILIRVNQMKKSKLEKNMDNKNK